MVPRITENDFQLMGQQSLAAYAAAVYPPLQIPPHIDILIQALEMVEQGMIDRLMIMMPPRHSKSQCTSRIFPAWYLGKHPDHMFMQVSYGQDLADGFGQNVRTNINSDAHKFIFPGSELRPDARAKSHFELTAGGEYNALGIGGGATGKGSHCTVIDDPLKGAEQAYSSVIRNKVKEWYQSECYTRLEPNGKIILVQTRWHEDDLAGWLLNPDDQEQVEDWHLLSMPAIAERDEGWRQEGDPLWPERYDTNKLERIKIMSSQQVWAALYQQRPSLIEGLLIKREWLGEYAWNPHMMAMAKVSQMVTGPYRIMMSIDSALEEKQSSDYSVITTFLSTARGEYVLDVWRGKVTTPVLEQKVKELALYWRAHGILIEDSTASKSFIQGLEVRTKLPIIRVKPEGSKYVRAQAVTPFMAAHRLFLPTHAPWLKEFIAEIIAFPTAAHDDQLDTLSQYLHWVMMQYEALAKVGVDVQSGADYDPIII